MRLELRPISSGDVGFLLQLRNENHEWFFGSKEIERQEHLEWFRRYVEDWWDVMFVISADGTDIGTIALYDIDTRRKEAEVGRIIIDKAYRRKGYAAASLKLVIDHGQELFGIEHFRLSFTLGNVAALNLYKKLGFTIRKRGDRFHGYFQARDRATTDG